MNNIKLWELNKEFEIEINYPYTHNFPGLKITSHIDGLILSTPLWDKSLKEYMAQLLKKYPESDFLNKLFKQTGV